MHTARDTENQRGVRMQETAGYQARTPPKGHLLGVENLSSTQSLRPFCAQRARTVEVGSSSGRRAGKYSSPILAWTSGH